jgi:hypothetical protein
MELICGKSGWIVSEAGEVNRMVKKMAFDQKNNEDMITHL